MKIGIIDRNACKRIRQELEHAIDVQSEVWESYGLKVKVGSARFTSSSVEFKVEVATVAEDGTVASREAREFKTYAPLFGLKAEDLGRKFQAGGRTYTVTGCKPRSKSSILADRDDGKRYKFPPETVKALLASQSPAPAASPAKDPDKPFSSDLDLDTE